MQTFIALSVFLAMILCYVLSFVLRLCIMLPIVLMAIALIPCGLDKWLERNVLIPLDRLISVFEA